MKRLGAWVVWGSLALFGLVACFDEPFVPEYPIQTPAGAPPLGNGLPVHAPVILPSAPWEQHLNLGPVATVQGIDEPELSEELLAIAHTIQADALVREVSAFDERLFVPRQAITAPRGHPQQRGDEPLRHVEEPSVQRIPPVGLAEHVRVYRAIRWVERMPPPAPLQHPSLPEHLRERFVGAPHRQAQLDTAYALFAEDLILREQYEEMRHYLATHI